MDGDIQDLDGWSTKCSPTPAWSRARRPEVPAVDLDALLDQVIDELAPLRAEVRVLRGECQGWMPTRLGRGRAALPAPRAAEPGEQCHAPRRVEVRLSYQLGQQRCRIDVEDDGPGSRKAPGTASSPRSPAWTTAAPAPRAGMAWACRSCGGSSTGTRPGHGGAQRALGGACFSLNWPRSRHRIQTLIRLSRWPSCGRTGPAALRRGATAPTGR
jgi:two-component system sensor histidine kinase RstB